MSSSPPPDARRRLRRPRSLTGRLIGILLLLVALVSVLVVGLTTLALRQFLLSRLDAQLVAASQRHDGGPPDVGYPGGRPPGAGFPCAAEPTGSGDGLGFGQGVGTLIGRFDSQCRGAVVVSDDGSLESVAPSVAATLSSLAPSSSPRSVDLPTGTFRVIVTDTDGATSVTGLPTAGVSDTLRSVAAWESVIGLGAVLVAGAVGSGLVRRELAPLRRVAATATEVTRLPLETGEVGVTARVPAELTDASTEVGQVGAALNAMLGHVELALDTRHESEQRVRRFVADASHELRTPLTTIMGYAELSRRTPDDAAGLQHAMSRIQAESGRMGSLVSDLLLLARLDSGRPLDRGDVDLSLLLAEAVNDARVVSTDHVWRLRLPADALAVVGDRDRLLQVLSNLLTNAFRHTPAGATVTVSAAEAGHRDGARPEVVVTVHDDGPGMPAALVGKEFERFSRGDTSRTRASGGSGLGLSIVQAIVAAHDGSVEIASRPGDTTVTVRLPSGQAVPPAGQGVSPPDLI